MFDYQQLETLIDVEREGSFENTARRKRVSKSAISQKSRHIDQRLGLATIGRSPSSPTMFGKSLCRHIEKIKLLESSLVVKYGHIFDPTAFDRAALRVAVDDELPTRFLLEQLEPKIDGESRFPFETIISRGMKAVERLEAQDVAATLSAQPLASDQFSSHALGDIPLIATASPEYARKVFRNQICGKSVLDAKSASYDHANELNARFIHETLGVDLGAPSFKISSHHGVLNLCVDGLAWAMLPTHLVGEHIKNGRLINLCPEHVLEIPLYWNVSAFLDELISDITTMILGTARRLTASDAS